MANGIKNPLVEDDEKRKRDVEDILREIRGGLPEKLAPPLPTLQERFPLGEADEPIVAPAAAAQAADLGDFGTRPDDVSIDAEIKKLATKGEKKQLDKLGKKIKEKLTRAEKDEKKATNNVRQALMSQQKEAEIRAKVRKRVPRPSALEEGIVMASGGLLGVFGGTKKRRTASKEAEEQAIKRYRELQKDDRAVRDAAKRAKLSKTVRHLSESGQTDLESVLGIEANEKHFNKAEWAMVNPSLPANMALIESVTKPNAPTLDLAKLKHFASIAKRAEVRRVAGEAQRDVETDKKADMEGKSAYDPLTGKMIYPPDFDKRFPKGSSARMIFNNRAKLEQRDLSTDVRKQIEANRETGTELYRQILSRKGDPMGKGMKFLRESPHIAKLYFTDDGIKMLKGRNKLLTGYMARFGKPYTHKYTDGAEESRLIQAISANQAILYPTPLTKEQKDAGKKPPPPLSQEAFDKMREATDKMEHALSSVRESITGNYAEMELMNKNYDALVAEGREVEDTIWKTNFSAGNKNREQFEIFVRPDESMPKPGESVTVSERNEDGDWIDSVTGKEEPDGEAWTLYDKTYFEWVPSEDKKAGYRAVKREFLPWIQTFRDIVPQFIGEGADIKEFFDLGKTSRLLSTLYTPITKEALAARKPRVEADVGKVRIEQRDTGPGESVYTRNPREISERQQGEIDRVRAAYALKGWGLIIKEAGGAQAYVDSVFSKDPDQLPLVRELDAEDKAALLAAARMEGMTEDRKSQMMKKVFLDMLINRLIPESRTNR